MAKKVDDLAETFVRMLRARADATKLRRELKAADDEAKICNDIIAKEMGKARIGSIGGKNMFEVVDTSRTTYTKAKVMEVCPEKEEQLRSVHTGKKIVPLPSAFSI